VKELNKIIEGLKMEIETIKKSQRGATLDMENLEKRSSIADAHITNRIQQIEETILRVEDAIEDIDTALKESMKCQKFLTQNIQEIQDTVRRPNLRITGIEDRENSQCEGPGNVFNKNIEENYLT
jgi:molecular chaperone GrpE (heat shock protein)